jgi:hypothetical protein
MTRMHQVRQKTPRHFSPWRPINQKMLVYCCDCGLCHEYRFSRRMMRDGKIYMGKRIRRHEAETKLERKRVRKKFMPR